MMFHNGEEVREHLWEELRLSGRSITFHLFEISDESHLYVGGGIVESSDDMYDCDRYFDVGYERAEDAEIGIEYVESYLIGDGEAENGDSDDAQVLENVSEDSPSAFDEFIRAYADHLASIKDFRVENPAYDCYALDVDEDDEDE